MTPFQHRKYRKLLKWACLKPKIPLKASVNIIFCLKTTYFGCVYCWNKRLASGFVKIYEIFKIPKIARIQDFENFGDFREFLEHSEISGIAENSQNFAKFRKTIVARGADNRQNYFHRISIIQKKYLFEMIRAILQYFMSVRQRTVAVRHRTGRGVRWLFSHLYRTCMFMIPNNPLHLYVYCTDAVLHY
mgnify:CR=1 FL=1